MRLKSGPQKPRRSLELADEAEWGCSPLTAQAEHGPMTIRIAVRSRHFGGGRRAGGDVRPGAAPLLAELSHPSIADSKLQWAGLRSGRRAGS